MTFTAVVTRPGYQGTPTGTVTFTIDGHAQTPVPLVVGRGPVRGAVHDLHARGGPALGLGRVQRQHIYRLSSGSMSTQTVTASGLHTTTTTLASSLNPSTVGQPVTFTAVVTAPSYPGTPTGTVTFIIDGQAQTPVPLALVGGSDQAHFTTSALSAGSHAVSASYSGDHNVSASSGSLHHSDGHRVRLAHNDHDARFIAQSIDGGPVRDLHGRCLARWIRGNTIGKRDLHDRRRLPGARAAPVGQRQRSGHTLDRVPWRRQAHNQCGLQRRLVLRGKRRGEPAGPDGQGGRRSRCRRT